MKEKRAQSTFSCSFVAYRKKIPGAIYPIVYEKSPQATGWVMGKFRRLVQLSIANLEIEFNLGLGSGSIP